MNFFSLPFSLIHSFIHLFLHLFHLWHKKFPGQDLNLSHTCGNGRSFNPLPQARDWTCTSAVTWAAAARLLIHCATVGISSLPFWMLVFQWLPAFCHAAIFLQCFYFLSYFSGYHSNSDLQKLPYKSLSQVFPLKSILCYTVRPVIIPKHSSVSVTQSVNKPLNPMLINIIYIRLPLALEVWRSIPETALPTWTHRLIPYTLIRSILSSPSSTITSMASYRFCFWSCSWHVEVPRWGIKPVALRGVDNARSLTCCATRNILGLLSFMPLFILFSPFMMSNQPLHAFFQNFITADTPYSFSSANATTMPSRKLPWGLQWNLVFAIGCYPAMPYFLNTYSVPGFPLGGMKQYNEEDTFWSQLSQLCDCSVILGL